ncbi:hypothetical protein [Halodesulfovibrio sp.]|uniref:hypothetical protein n=1 Tax=Halodesulfovibrio sp. TaxID=1912772 RepID=UPI0025C70DA9|nr:hypothetical protein [Halodesulfovibrio sp.]
MRSNRSINITEEYRNKIIWIIDGWQGKLTWDLLLTKIKRQTGLKYTRQALSKHPQIIDAYQRRKKVVTKTKLVEERSAASYSQAEIQAIVSRNNQLKIENEQLRAQNERLMLKFVVWSTNAHTRGLTEEFLNRPLNSIDRDATKSKAS